jgi:protein involved in polysaccharide export with SLBB domain
MNRFEIATSRAPRQALSLIAALLLFGAAPLQAENNRNTGTTAGSNGQAVGLAMSTNLPGSVSPPSLSTNASPSKPAAEKPPAPVSLPALAENDFQRFVREATGQLAPIPLFGTALFSQAASPAPLSANNATPTEGETTQPIQASSMYAPVQNTPVTLDYAVGPGDELLIRIWGALDAELRIVVDQTGQISIPKVGTFSVTGIKAAELDDYIRGKIARVYRNFELSVTLGQLRSIQVYVVGHARLPGTYTLSSLSTLVNALFASGGPSSTGSMRHVQLKRKGALVAELDLYDFIIKGDNRADVRLQNGDVITIPSIGAQVAVLGTVNTPAIYELKGADANLDEVLQWGGGLPVTATTRRATLERIQPSQSVARSAIQLSLDDAGRATRLRDGDMLSIHEISPQFENVVTLRGNVSMPLRYRFTPGMRIRDLIPERDALIVPDYHKRNNRLIQVVTDSSTGIQDRVRNSANEVNWDYALIERLNPGDLSTQMIPFNLGKAVLDSNPAHNLELKSGDVVTIFSKSDVAVPQARQTRLVNVAGEVNAAGVYQLLPGETLRQLLARAGGLTPQAYVFGTEFTREETRRAQQERLDQALRRLEALMASEVSKQLANVSSAADGPATQAMMLQQQQLEQQYARLKTLKANGRIALELPLTASTAADLPDLPLQDGDRVLVPARNSFVTAVGAVNNDNALIWKPGRTVSDALGLAGPTDAADMDNIFLLRADGTVVSQNQQGRWLFTLNSGIEGVELMPGDAIVVPEKLDRRSIWTHFMIGLKDWTQILYQMGLGAAAWKTLN